MVSRRNKTYLRKQQIILSFAVQPGVNQWNVPMLYSTQPVNQIQQSRLNPGQNRQYAPYPPIRPYTQQFLDSVKPQRQYGQPPQASTNLYETLPGAFTHINHPQNNGFIRLLMPQGKLNNYPIYVYCYSLFLYYISVLHDMSLPNIVIGKRFFIAKK